MSYISSMTAFTWLLNEIVFVTFCALWNKKTFAYTFCSQDVKQNKKWSHTVLIHFLKEPCLLIVIKVSPFHCHQFTFFTFSLFHFAGKMKKWKSEKSELMKLHIVKQYESKQIINVTSFQVCLQWCVFFHWSPFSSWLLLLGSNGIHRI